MSFLGVDFVSCYLWIIAIILYFFWWLFLTAFMPYKAAFIIWLICASPFIYKVLMYGFNFLPGGYHG